MLIQDEVARIERESLIDFALATHNEELFKRIMNGEEAEPEQDTAGKETVSRDDFIRQVNLKAWI
ncbi:hypothetical protein D3C80_2228170 [compost metagenome]